MSAVFWETAGRLTRNHGRRNLFWLFIMVTGKTRIQVSQQWIASGSQASFIKPLVAKQQFASNGTFHASGMVGIEPIPFKSAKLASAFASANYANLKGVVAVTNGWYFFARSVATVAHFCQENSHCSSYKAQTSLFMSRSQAVISLI